MTGYHGDRNLGAMLIFPAIVVIAYITTVTVYDGGYAIIFCSIIIPMGMAVGFLLFTMYTFTQLTIQKDAARALRNILLTWLPFSLVLTSALFRDKLDAIYVFDVVMLRPGSLIMLGLWVCWGVFNYRATKHASTEPPDSPVMQLATLWSWVAYGSFTISTICIGTLAAMNSGN